MYEMTQEVERSMWIIWEFLAVRDEPVLSDAIFVFGSGQLRVPRHAADLYHRGLAPLILVSGGQGGPLSRHLFGGRPEYEIFIEELVANGVPRDRILTETNASHTGENILFGMEALRIAGIEPKKLLLISTPQHMRRVIATFKKWEPEIDLRSCPPDGEPLEFATLSTQRFLWVLVHEVRRLVEYAKQELLIEQEIPASVMQAVDTIRRVVPEVDPKKIV